MFLLFRKSSRSENSLLTFSLLSTYRFVLLRSRNYWRILYALRCFYFYFYFRLLKLFRCSLMMLLKIFTWMFHLDVYLMMFITMFLRCFVLIKHFLRDPFLAWHFSYLSISLKKSRFVTYFLHFHFEARLWYFSLFWSHLVQL